jgi:hypothetical protein
MVGRVFVDTGAWYAVQATDDLRHSTAQAVHPKAREEDGRTAPKGAGGIRGHLELVQRHFSSPPAKGGTAPRSEAVPIMSDR